MIKESRKKSLDLWKEASKVNWERVRNDFPMLRNGILMQGKPLVWLDNASTTFKPDYVRKAVEEYYTNSTANSHRGDYDLCYQMDMAVMDARSTLAKMINAKAEEIVFTSGDTMSINLVAYGYACQYLKDGDEIVISTAEHASNILPWYRVCELTGAKIVLVPLSKEGRITPENLESVMSERTKIVALAQVGNVLGFVLPIKEIAKIVHAYNALFVVDGAQSVPHLPVDVSDSDIDFLAWSGHKMCGPTGIGVLYGKYELLKKMRPFMSGGGMNAKFDSCGNVSFLEPPMRFEAGTLNLEGIVGLNAAAKYLSNIGLNNIQKRDQELKRYAVELLSKISGVTIYNPTSESGIITFNVDGVFAQDCGTYLNSQGIALRSGQHCAKILTDFLGTPATLRASFYLYTSKKEIDTLADALYRAKEDYLNAYF